MLADPSVDPRSLRIPDTRRQSMAVEKVPERNRCLMPSALTNTRSRKDTAEERKSLEEKGEEWLPSGRRRPGGAPAALSPSSLCCPPPVSGDKKTPSSADLLEGAAPSFLALSVVEHLLCAPQSIRCCQGRSSDSSASPVPFPLRLAEAVVD